MVRFLDRLAEASAPKPKAKPKRAAQTDKELSKAEIRVLALLATGKVYGEIAEETGLAVSTVRTHLHNIYGKLGVTDRAQAVLTAVRQGVIEDPSGNGVEGDLTPWERTLRGEIVDRVDPRDRPGRVRDRRPVADIIVEGPGPRPFLSPSEADPLEREDVPPRKEGALADVLIALNLKGLRGTEDELAAAYEAAMDGDGFDRYGKLVKLAAVSMLAAVRVRVLSE